MFVVRLSQARREDVEGVESRIERCGTLVRSVALGQDDFILFQSDEDVADLQGDIGSLPAVAALQAIETPYVLSARACRPGRTSIRGREAVDAGTGRPMTFVPYVPPPVPPSPRTQELSRRLRATVESFRQENPEVTAAEVRAALDLVKGRAAPAPAVIILQVGLAVLGFLGFLLLSRMSSGSAPPLASSIAVGVGILTLALVFLLRRR